MAEINRSQKIRALYERHRGQPIQVFETEKILRGWISFEKSRGWLDIQDEGNYWAVTFMNGQDGRSLLDEPTYGADFTKDTGGRMISPPLLTGAWKTAITTWPVEEEKEANRIFDHVSRMVDLAYDRYRKEPMFGRA